MNPEKDQKTKSDDTSEDKQIATSTEGCLLHKLVILVQYSNLNRKKN